MRDDNDWLNGVMTFDHPVRVNEDGSVTGSLYNVYAPEAVIGTSHDGSVLKEHEDRWTEALRAQGWEPERGWTGQYRYHGPLMHSSEFIGGNLAAHILATPGVWVAVVVECLRGDPDPGSLTCVTCGVSLTGSDTGLYEDLDAPPSADRDSARYCDEAAGHLHSPYSGAGDDDDDGPAGWAVLYMDDGPDTASYVVTTRPGEITSALISGRARVTLPVARQLAGLVPHLPARIVRVTDLAVMPAGAPAWFSAGTDEPGDQQRDLDVPRDPALAGYWGLTGPRLPDDGFEWSVIDGEDGETVAGGSRDTEDEAKAAVNAWELRHKITGCPPATAN